jgi:hypothetical protein
MSKIITAVNTMILKNEKISDVTEGDDEYFFLYDGKYKWSITYSKNKDSYYIHYYSGSTTISELANVSADEWANYTYITYDTDSINTVEADSTFKELYTIVKEKLFGIDEVLDDIIG